MCLAWRSTASRIEQLRAQQQAKTEAKLEISRDRIVRELADMAFAKGSSMMKLKAIELLARMQGYNEVPSVQHNHLHLQVNSALMAELRAGHAALLAIVSNERTQSACRPGVEMVVDGTKQLDDVAIEPKS
jgi:hypothetical protein